MSGEELIQSHTISESDIVILYQSFRNRQVDRDARVAKIDAVVRGDFSVLDPNGTPIENKSPNLIQVALEDTAESAGIMPTVRVTPGRSGSKAKDGASRMEKVGAGYLDISQMDMVLPETAEDLAAFGYAAWMVWPDYEQRLPIIERLDPRMVYPDPDIKQFRDLRRAMIVRNVRYGQLSTDYRDKLQQYEKYDQRWGEENVHLILVEFWTDIDYTCAVLFQTAMGAASSVQSPSYNAVILEQWDHGLGTCPVIYEQRPTLDKHARGQFDQVIDPFEAHIRLMGLVLDYADQAVYSDVWVKDLIGELSFGGGAFIELGPNGGIGRVPPAVSSLNVQQDLDRLVEGIHLGGRWPKSRPGEVDQSIASAKFIEAAAGMMNTALRTYHMLMQRMLVRALRVSYITDQKHFPGKKSISGVLHNQEFIEEYDPSNDIDLKNRVRVEYGLGLGRDPGQSAILMLQYAQNGYISNDFVQENIEGVVDVDRERRRIDLQDLTKMAKAMLLQGLTDGTVPHSALVDIAQDRDGGSDLFELYRKYIVEPQQAQPIAGVPPATLPGLPPAGATPGAAPGAPGAGGFQPPPAPDPSKLFSRLDTTMGGRGDGTSATQARIGIQAGG